jgi:hypothetical protein
MNMAGYMPLMAKEVVVTVRYLFVNYRHLTAAEYGMPIDEDELDRIDMKHRMYTMLLDENYFLAPIGSNPQRILDLGTGSGGAHLDAD